MSPNDTLKRCSKCGEVKSISDFGKYKKAKDGLKSWCRACCSVDGKKYYEGHKSEHAETMKQWRLNNLDKARQLNRDWQQANREKSRSFSRRWRCRHVDEARRAARNWQKAHPEQVRANEHRHRARQSAVASTFTANDWEFALDYFNGCCAYCGNPPSLFEVNPLLQQEHHIPTTKGGNYTPDNILPACRFCNISKKDRDAKEWVIKRFGAPRSKSILKRIADYFAVIDSRQTPE